MKYYVLRISTDVLFRRDPATTQEAVWKDGEWRDSSSRLAGMLVSGRTELDEISAEEAKKLEKPKPKQKPKTLTLDELNRVWRYACANGGNPFPDNPEAVKQYAEFRAQISEIPPGTRVMAESTFDWPDAQYDNLLRKGDRDA